MRTVPRTFNHSICAHEVSIFRKRNVFQQQAICKSHLSYTYDAIGEFNVFKVYTIVKRIIPKRFELGTGHSNAFNSVATIECAVKYIAADTHSFKITRNIVRRLLSCFCPPNLNGFKTADVRLCAKNITERRTCRRAIGICRTSDKRQCYAFQSGTTAECRLSYARYAIRH